MNIPVVDQRWVTVTVTVTVKRHRRRRRRRIMWIPTKHLFMLPPPLGAIVIKCDIPTHNRARVKHDFLFSFCIKKKSFYFFGKQKFLFFIFYEVTLESLMYIMLQFNVTMFMVTSWHLSNEIWKVQSPNGRTLKLNSSSKIHICDIDKICIQLSLDEFYFSKKKFRRILPNWVRWHHIQLTCVIILNHLTH